MPERVIEVVGLQNLMEYLQFYLQMKSAGLTKQRDY